MGFASSYLEQRTVFPEIIKEAPERNTGIVIIVPAYDEPGIGKLLDSLALCLKPECEVEVLIIINAPENATPESLKNNFKTAENIESWKKHNKCFFRLFSFMANPVKGWGVGLARKTGMDEAVRRFDLIDKADGIILNLDADCTVEENYLTAIWSEFREKKSRSACSIYFEHPLEGNEFSEEVYKNITLYELHLRYYYQALVYTGCPHVFHTVGSAMAVRALAYVKSGGMNRRQAGEDFYFIQKLIPAGGFFSIASTTVLPSPRPSFRVPFGTGATIAKLSDNGETFLYSYNIQAFKDLKTFFEMKGMFFGNKNESLQEIYEIVPESIRAFIPKPEFVEKIGEIKDNTSISSSFDKRFSGWFNMFKIIKYLNFSHQKKFEKLPVQKAARELLKIKSISDMSDSPAGLLQIYRELEKNKQT